MLGGSQCGLAAFSRDSICQGFPHGWCQVESDDLFFLPLAKSRSSGGCGLDIGVTQRDGLIERKSHRTTVRLRLSSACEHSTAPWP